MISALAFGYGVGMAAPDGTLSGVQGAVDGYRGSALQRAPAFAQVDPARARHAWAGQGPTAMAQPHPGYAPAAYDPRGYPLPGAPGQRATLGAGSVESRELARLRSIAGRGGPRACSADTPMYSAPPRYASDGARGSEEVDDLDTAGQEALTRLQLPDFNVAITRRALKYVRFLTRTDRGRGLFESWLKRSGRYQDMILEHLRERSLPEDLTWVAMIESGFNPTAKSPAGATGLWQFMRSTGEVYGLEVSPYIDLRKNPVEATRAASHHLRDLYQRFGSWDLAMAAYNMGYEQLLDSIDTYGTTDFAELSRQRAIPSETAAYVPKIVAAALVANNLERYGFDDVRLYKPKHTAEMTVPGGTSLGTIAKAAGISKGTFRKFNPHLLSNHLPPGGDTLVLLPSDTLSRARAALPAMMDRRQPSDADVLDPLDWAGDKAFRRDRRHRTWNEGENLLAQLPKPKRRSMRSRLRATVEDSVDDRALAQLSDEFGPKRSGRETVMYRVGPGDTLLGVARQFAVDIEDLARDNGLEVDAKLREGALLKLMVNQEVLDRKSRRKSGRQRDAAEPQKRKKSAKKQGRREHA